MPDSIDIGWDEKADSISSKKISSVTGQGMINKEKVLQVKENKEDGRDMSKSRFNWDTIRMWTDLCFHKMFPPSAPN